MTELKNSGSGLNIKLDVAEERISELRNGSVKKIYMRGKKYRLYRRNPLLKTINGAPHGGEKTVRGIRNASRG